MNDALIHITTIALMLAYVVVKDGLPLIRKNGSNGNGRYDPAQAALRKEEMRDVMKEVFKDALASQVVPILAQIAKNTEP